jgi:L-2-hydroxyglutarate oxidase
MRRTADKVWAVRVGIVGGGIVGLAVAHELSRRGRHVVVLEKESDWARHQTGRNSGVIHSGVYYTPGSIKARTCVAGARSMVEFAREHGVPVKITGKLVVATEPGELPRLRRLAARAADNGVPAELIGPGRARDHEPNVRCLEALHVRTTGIVDYVGVCRALVTLLRDKGQDLRTGVQVTGVRPDHPGLVLETTTDPVRVDALVGCAGLGSDLLAAAAGLRPSARIIPFRGEYFELARPELVSGLIYPVPNPALPFLGVHLTRGIDGSVHVGPNAVLALAREGYDWRTISPRDLAGVLTFPGSWRLARRFPSVAVSEVRRSLSRRRFAADLARLVPQVTVADLRPAPAGVRAQAVGRDGSLVDDFLFARAARQVHVLNAPSPAATCALEIATQVADELESQT